MNHRTRWTAGLSALVLLLIAAATAVGYTGQVASSITVATRGTVACEAPFTMTATILDGAGAPVAGQSVDWSFVTSPSASDVIDPTTSITDAQGVATTTVTLAPVSGTREIRATADGVSASAVLGPACGGLPSTSTLPAESSGGAPLAALFLAAICAFGGGLALRNRVATRS
jgi:hypothetical protein